VSEAPSTGTTDAAGDDALLRVEGLRVEFPAGGGRRLRAVDDISFVVHRDETLAIVGESGCGKTTTAQAIVRLVEPAAGRVTFDGLDVLSLGRRAMQGVRRRMQLVFQDPYTSLNPRLPAGKILSEPLDIHRVGSSAERRARVHELLHMVGLDPGLATRRPHAFSGGQRQRLAIARALALEPELIVADEPVSALDVSVRAQVLNLLADLRERLHLTYVVIAHDLALVRQVSERVAVMYLGEIVELSGTEALFRGPGHPYTVALLSAVPVPDPEVEVGRERITLRGDVPSPIDPPGGCRFHPRCWLREQLGNPPACATTKPELRGRASLDGAHAAACHFTEEMHATDRYQETVTALAASHETSATDARVADAD
jgi:oligopeptide/dipeptide ABC transporter ATP-binding protein